MTNRSPLSPTHCARRAILALAVASLVLAGGIRASDAHEEDSPLHQAMEGMGRCLRKLSRQVEDPAQLESSKALLAKMKENAEKAKALEPPLDKEMPAAERAKWIAKFKEGMDKVIATIGEAETALGEEKLGAAKEKVRDLREEREAGHKEFDVEED